MKFKLDENLSSSLLTMFARAGHDTHSVVQQALGGAPDERVIDVCRREGRALITLDLDFSNILADAGEAHLVRYIDDFIICVQQGRTLIEYRRFWASGLVNSRLHWSRNPQSC